MMTDDFVRSLISESIKEVKSIRSLSQVLLSVMEMVKTPDIDGLIEVDFPRPEITQALAMAKAAYTDQGTQSFTLIKQEKKPGPLSKRVKNGEA